ncbi:hypothetical protein [Modestobacter sp. SYSU DS0875]
MRSLLLRHGRARHGVVGCAVAALALATALVWQSSYAGFTATTPAHALPTISTGTVTLTDDDAEGTLFTVDGLKPGASDRRCIVVTSQGTLPATVRLYVTGVSSRKGLADHLRLTVRSGTGGTFAGPGGSGCSSFRSQNTVYDGTLSAFPADDWARGRGGWDTTGTSAEQRTYEVKYTLPAGTPLTVQGGSATATLVWEAHSR